MRPWLSWWCLLPGVSGLVEWGAEGELTWRAETLGVGLVLKPAVASGWELEWDERGASPDDPECPAPAKVRLGDLGQGGYVAKPQPARLRKGGDTALLQRRAQWPPGRGGCHKLGSRANSSRTPGSVCHLGAANGPAPGLELRYQMGHACHQDAARTHGDSSALSRARGVGQSP